MARQSGPTAELVIFDCDGVLIDSEIVVCRLASEELARVGYRVSLDEVIDRFTGRPEREMVADIEADWGQALPRDYHARMRQRVGDAYAQELRAMQGAAALLEHLSLPVCVASSSAPDKLRMGLHNTGLERYFKGNLISAASVAQGKPAPDVFIYAAGWMGVPVGSCVVVEDSVPGVRAACRAGMQVFGFTGGSHCRPDHGARLMQAGAQDVIAALSALLARLPATVA